MYRMRSLLPVAAILLSIALSPFCIAQDVEALRSGVVKIVATRVEEGMAKTKTGTGFIVDLYPDAAIIVTASHVVENTDKIAVQFSVRGDVTFSAEVKRMRGADPRGLAVLAVKNPPSGLATLSLSNK
jgi:S1-C subfamily serine protease